MDRANERYKQTNVRVVNDFGLPVQSFQVDETAKQHRHLNQAVPKILVGAN